MVQQTSTNQTKQISHPKRRDFLLHAGKSLKLIGALLGDSRIAAWRKLFFVGTIVALLAILIFPDAFGEIVFSTILPLVGTVLGIPIDAGFDWMAFALVVVSLLKVFPAELIAEHYRSIFNR